MLLGNIYHSFFKKVRINGILFLSLFNLSVFFYYIRTRYIIGYYCLLFSIFFFSLNLITKAIKIVRDKSKFASIFFLLLMFDFIILLLFSNKNIRIDYDSGSFKIATLFLNNHKIFPTFLPGYPTFLSGFFNLFDIKGFFIANFILLSDSLLTLFLITKEIILKRKNNIPFFVILVFNFMYPTVWFSKQTLAENLALPLFLNSLFFLTLFIKNKRFISYMLGVPYIFTSLLVRPESIVFVLSYLALGFFYMISKKVNLKKLVGANLLEVFVVLGIPILVVYTLLKFNYKYESKYITMYLNKIPILVERLVGSGFSKAESGNLVTQHPTFTDYSLIYSIKSLAKYPPLILLPISILLLLKSRNIRIFPLLLFLPGFIFLKYPTTSWVHPWFIRHFWLILMPTFLLLIIAPLSKLKKNFFVISLLALCTFLSSVSLLFYQPYQEVGTLISLFKKYKGQKYAISINGEKLRKFYPFLENYLDLEADKWMSRKFFNDSYEPRVLISSEQIENEKYPLIKKTKFNFSVLEVERGADNYVKPELFDPPLALKNGFRPLQESLERIPAIGRAQYIVPIFIYSIN